LRHQELIIIPDAVISFSGCVAGRPELTKAVAAFEMIVFFGFVLPKSWLQLLAALIQNYNSVLWRLMTGSLVDGLPQMSTSTAPGRIRQSRRPP
jgi:hypothetical protein